MKQVTRKNIVLIMLVLIPVIFILSIFTTTSEENIPSEIRTTSLKEPTKIIITKVLTPTPSPTSTPSPSPTLTPTPSPEPTATPVPVVTEEVDKKEGLSSANGGGDQYPEARFVWDFLKNQGFNDYVVAGILGNMMTECGGQTLALQPYIYGYGKTYYGLCQWSKTWYSEVHGKDIQFQMEFLMSNIEEEFNMFGGCYGGKNFKYKDFLALQDEKEAAKAFAKCYERCGSTVSKRRLDHATTALKYFTQR